MCLILGIRKDTIYLMKKFSLKISFLIFALLSAIPNKALAEVIPGYNLVFKGFDSMFGVTCNNYDCWISEAWKWTLAIIIPLSVVVVIIAGIVYMTSAGDPNRIAFAKKLLLGVASGLGLLILARVFLATIFGPGVGWNV